MTKGHAYPRAGFLLWQATVTFAITFLCWPAWSQEPAAVRAARQAVGWASAGRWQPCTNNQSCHLAHRAIGTLAFGARVNGGAESYYLSAIWLLMDWSSSFIVAVESQRAGSDRPQLK